MATSPKSFQQVLQELWELLKAYAQQETVGPLKALGKRLGLGLAGSFAVGLGVFLLILGVVRFLQTRTLPLIGPWFQVHNWAVYLIGCALLGLACYVCIRKARADPFPAKPDLPTVSSTPTAEELP